MKWGSAWLETVEQILQNSNNFIILIFTKSKNLIIEIKLDFKNIQRILKFNYDKVSFKNKTLVSWYRPLGHFLDMPLPTSY